MEKFVEMLSNIGEWLLNEGIKVVIAFLVYWIFCKVINSIFKKIQKRMDEKNLDKTVKKLSVIWGKRIIKFIAFVSVLTYLGIETSGIAAAITSVGLTIGLALQGALSNFAGGIVIVITKPFKTGDFIQSADSSGTVDEIDLFYTYLTTPDNKRVVIPNGKVISDKIINFNVNKTRRDEIVVAIGYDEDFVKAKELIWELIKGQERILESPKPLVNVSSHSDKRIDITVRFWTQVENFWDMHWYMIEAIKIAFDNNGIKIPYPHLDVNIKDINK